MDSGRKAIKALAREAALLPQEELLQAKQDQAELTIGIPAETSLQEKRVALVPEAVALLVAHGHQVLVETQAGAEAQFSDNDYSEAGARIVYDRRQVFQAHIVLKVEPPSLEEVVHCAVPLFFTSASVLRSVLSHTQNGVHDEGSPALVDGKQHVAS